MTRLLLHVCCAPCSAYAVPAFREAGAEVDGYFLNPNIHPAPEYRRRAEALERYAPSLGLPVTFAPEYRPEDYFSAVSFHGADRCRRCYALRLRGAAREARRRGCDAFSTTLLGSVHQKHELVRAVGEAVGAEVGVPFLYRDLRTGWQQGCDRYRETGLYRQRYCGCVTSERERREPRRRPAAGRRVAP